VKRYMDVPVERMRCMVLMQEFGQCMVLERLSLVELFSELSVVNSLLGGRVEDMLNRKVRLGKDMLYDRMLLKILANISEKEEPQMDKRDVEAASEYGEQEEGKIGEAVVTCKDVLGLILQFPQRSLVHPFVEDKNIAVPAGIVLKSSVQLVVDNVLLDGNLQEDSDLGDTVLLYG